MTTDHVDADTPQAPGARRRAASLVALSGLALLIAGAPLAGGVLGALVLGVALDSPYQRLASRIGPRRAAALMLVACLLLLFVPAVLIGHLSLEQLRAIDARAGGSLRDRLQAGGAVGGDAGDVLRRLTDLVTSSVAGIATWVAGSAAHGLVNLSVMFVCLYFVLQSGDTLWTRVRTFLPFSAESSELLRADLRRVTKATLLGTMLSAVLQGASMAAGFLLAGLGGAAFWGVITMFASLVPVLGSAIVWVPAVLYLLAQRQIGAAVIVVVFGWVLATAIDQITRTTISRRLGSVHPLTTLLGALIGVRLFGMVGLVAGPLMISLFVELLAVYERDYGVAAAGAGNAPVSPPLTVTEKAP